MPSEYLILHQRRVVVRYRIDFLYRALELVSRCPYFPILPQKHARPHAQPRIYLRMTVFPQHFIQSADSD